MSNMHDTVNQLLFTITRSLNLPVTSWFAATYFCDQGFRMESTYKRYFEKGKFTASFIPYYVKFFLTSLQDFLSR